MKRLIVSAALGLFAMSAMAQMPMHDEGYEGMHRGGMHGGMHSGMYGGMYGEGYDRQGKSSRYQERHEAKVKALAELLGLNDKQAESMKKVLDERREAYREMREEARKQMEQKRKAIHDDTNKKLDEILNKTQLLQFEAFTRGMKMNRGHHYGGMHHYKGE